MEVTRIATWRTLSQGTTSEYWTLHLQAPPTQRPLCMKYNWYGEATGKKEKRAGKAARRVKGSLLHQRTFYLHLPPEYV